MKNLQVLKFKMEEVAMSAYLEFHTIATGLGKAVKESMGELAPDILRHLYRGLYKTFENHSVIAGPMQNATLFIDLAATPTPVSAIVVVARNLKDGTSSRQLFEKLLTTVPTDGASKESLDEAIRVSGSKVEALANSAIAGVHAMLDKPGPTEDEDEDEDGGEDGYERVMGSAAAVLTGYAAYKNPEATAQLISQPGWKEGKLGLFQFVIIREDSWSIAVMTIPASERDYAEEMVQLLRGEFNSDEKAIEAFLAREFPEGIYHTVPAITKTPMHDLGPDFTVPSDVSKEYGVH